MRSVALGLLAVCGCACSTAGEPPQSPAERETFRRLAQAAIVPLFERMGPPQEHEWLAEHPEEGQTFLQYRDQYESRELDRRIIYIQPVGTFSRRETQIIEDVQAAMSIFFDRQVKRLPALPLDLAHVPKDSWRINEYTKQPQVLTTTVLEALARRWRNDAMALIAFTAIDLYPSPSWNYVFGQASFSQPVGIWSLARFGDPESQYDRVLRRTIKLALHETGHMLGLRHCTAYRCGMNGTNNLAETDAGPLPFCPECERKLWWGLGIDVRARYDRLIDYAKTHHLPTEAKFWAATLDRIRAL